MPTPGELLKTYWNYPEFRGSQEAIINAVLSGHDVLALLPTGGGKSVCYQVPALASEGICIVVSPLVALIHDQVDSLKRKGIKALSLTGGLPFEEVINRLDNCLYGNYKFLYLSPERLQQDLVMERITQMNVSLVAIDEAHCISQWGNDFRPAYLGCSVIRELKPGVPLMALTATATPRVAQDIITNLQLSDHRVFKDSFYRENIIYRVLWEEDKHYRLKQLCQDTGGSVIVYVRSRRQSEELSAFLNANGQSSGFFHGGLPTKEKTAKLNAWLHGRTRIMVATNAFGMGIDKPDVSLVVHYQLPDSIENYFQEAGRAGRDGNIAHAVLLTNKTDEKQLKRQFLETLPGIDFLKHLYQKLNNYFQIPYGDGSNTTHNFQFNSFCETYKLNPGLTYNGLQILDQQSVISLSQHFNRQTEVQFISSKGQIMAYMEQHRGQAAVIQVILRTYGGITDYNTRINEVLIGRKAGVPEGIVTKILKQLYTDGLIEYKSIVGDLQLTFLVPREDDRTIHTFAKEVKEHQQQKTLNVEAMLRYVNDDRHCRSRQLLHYFGEKTKTNCGQCDVCLSRSPRKQWTDREKIADQIKLQLQQSNLTSRSLLHRLSFEEQEVIDTLREMLEDGLIGINNKNQYYLH
ncbi:RecQ family ATP-dependent DNA helicase [Zeaxanthinibacter enoshimensis]|uniref:ATP-dependent DNA helicase RecQ n=1 Tax=Zeaxanthinibacter enoshimensis TaxID=392009 RepID=A0A4R6TPD0_9FLAO|nr:RecQ family ATP-dependent DNA helicase [Zeaxanthinibacter enoshimensis]TDQ31221.1 ATP-dependent DNA helicase RecQ [Zeaxanthinibacter enoshimensis]